MSSKVIVVKNANIVTVNYAMPRANTMVIQNGLIEDIGVDLDVSKYEDAEVLDMQGRTILPGFIESHNHFNLVSTMYNWTDISNHKSFPTIDSVLAKIKQLTCEYDAEVAKEGVVKWIKLFGFDDTLIEECRGITKDEIDSVSGNYPVYIWHPSLHRAYVNSKAFELANINDDVVNPPGGSYSKKDGKLTGQVDEMPAYKPINSLIVDDSSLEVKIKSMWETGRKFASKGITSVQDLFCGPLLFQAYLAAFSKHNEKECPFPVRATCYCPANTNPIQVNHNPQFLRFAGKKMFADGSIQCHTACCSKGYHDQPEEKGEMALPVPALEKAILDIHKQGTQIAIHANGDEAIERVIVAFEKAQSACPRFNHRHRIEHSQMITPNQLTRLSRLGMCVSFFVSHVYFWGDRHRTIFLGEERSENISPLRTAIENNIAFGLHSDCPVTPAHPLHAIWVAVNRTTMSGVTLGEPQKITVEEAIRAYTIDAAYLAFEEHYKGSLERRKVADFIVLSDDILSIPTQEIENIQILETYLGGIKTYSNS